MIQIYFKRILKHHLENALETRRTNKLFIKLNNLYMINITDMIINIMINKLYII